MSEAAAPVDPEGGPEGSQPDPVAAAKAARKARRLAQGKVMRRIGAMLTEAPGEAHQPPQMLLDPRFKVALSYWRLMAPRLAERHLLGRFDRMSFCMLCYHMQEWVEAVDDIAENGFSESVPTISGGFMDRARWSVRRRTMAEARVMDLAGKFGLTPTDRFDLYGKLTRSNYDPQADMFTKPAERAGEGEETKGQDTASPSTGSRKDGWSDVLDTDKPN